MSALGKHADMTTIGGRLRAERKRLALSQEGLAKVAGVAKNTAINWERDNSSPTAAGLLAFANVGADALFIVTGRRENHDVAGQTVRQALAMLEPADRRALLLELVAEELRG